MHTRDEALRTQALAEAQGWHRIILVTSAGHMRRSEAVFRKLGLEVIPFACDFAGVAGVANSSTLKPAPSVGGFLHLEAYLHEVVGWWVYRWRGWL